MKPTFRRLKSQFCGISRVVFLRDLQKIEDGLLNFYAGVKEQTDLLRSFVHGESGVLLAREGFGELLREESQLEEQADCAPAQTLA
jgi:hypothetical protein